MSSHGVPRVSAVERSDQSIQKELKKIEEYKELVSQVQEKIRSEQYTAETLTLTSRLLSENPEYYTIWNYRRLILQDAIAKELATAQDDGGSDSNPSEGLTNAQHEIQLLLKEDLAFLIPILRGFPKCYWIWNHRAWLLAQASEHLPTARAKVFWKEEMGLVGKMLSYDSRNFHVWQYRRIVVDALENLGQKELEEQGQTGLDVISKSSLAETEYEYTTKMIKTNLSNFSAWHNRTQIIPKLLDERNADDGARRKMLDDEFDLITQALYTDPYDQSLWFYHSNLMTLLTGSAPPKLAIVKNFPNKDRLEYLETQLESLKDMLELTDDCKWIYQSLLTCSQQYLEIEAGNKKISTLEMRSWLEQLEKLDPLRRGRWKDWKQSLNL